jgi:hypothetical protein
MVTEVFNRIGESEIHSENSNFYKKRGGENEGFERFREPNKSESISKPISDVKKEFFEHLKDNDNSLTIDTCNNLNHDWKKK